MGKDTKIGKRHTRISKREKDMIRTAYNFSSTQMNNQKIKLRMQFLSQ